MSSVIRFPKKPVRRFARAGVLVAIDFGRWCAATRSGERLVRRSFARELAERSGLRFIEPRSKN